VSDTPALVEVLHRGAYGLAHHLVVLEDAAVDGLLLEGPMESFLDASIDVSRQTAPKTSWTAIPTGSKRVEAVSHLADVPAQAFGIPVFGVSVMMCPPCFFAASWRTRCGTRGGKIMRRVLMARARGAGGQPEHAGGGSMDDGYGWTARARARWAR